MARGTHPTTKRNVGCRTKVKTGCATCRIRKVKCDEDKPFCQKCVRTGRTCDGYESPFRTFTHQSINNVHASSIKTAVDFQPIQPTLSEVAPQDIALLNRYFSTKTLFDVDLGCDEEATQILEASSTDPAVRHALLSLKALREDLETAGDRPGSIAEQTLNYRYGLQQYGMALRSLASKLSSPDPKGLKSALLCCQILISIEQVRKTYAAMAQHIIRGLRIMHEYRARPTLAAGDTLMPAHPDQLPLLDVFIIKLFVAPCKFADAPSTGDLNGTTLPVSSDSPQQPVESRDLRAIVPNTRAELERIATSTLVFLGKVAQVETVEMAVQLLPEKTALLNSLESWLNDLEVVRTEIGRPGLEPVSVSFLRIFHIILRLILLGALNSSGDLDIELQTESNRLQDVTNEVGERVRDYITHNGTPNDRGKRSKVH